MIEDARFVNIDVGPKLHTGRTAEIFEYSQDKMVKLFFNNIPIESILYEFNDTLFVNQAGLPSAKAFFLVKHKDRKGIVFEKINGQDLIRILEKRPWNLFSIMKNFAQYHVNINKTKAALSINEQKILLNIRLESCAEILGHRMPFLRDLLDRLPSGQELLHGDYHFGNVLKTNTGQFLAIDWSVVYKGHFLSDVANTYLKLIIPDFSPDESRLQVKIKSAFTRFLAPIYINEYKKLRPFAEQDFQNWLIIISATSIDPDPDRATVARARQLLSFLDSLMGRLRASR